jgi:hypothetical protein
LLILLIALISKEILQWLILNRFSILLKKLFSFMKKIALYERTLREKDEMIIRLERLIERK